MEPERPTELRRIRQMEQKEQYKLEWMVEEINCVLKRNQNEEYLRHLLNCALAYEKALNR